ncbi:hypothetical protein FEM48_Zijuj07G0000900 [Ziziphus jujuba var. spinosa]|uniref:Uncharacterized protein n=1 Tax=Ziziphus jujuba var. spinosa TaxID=714518 RepID=A0A978V1A1_ZIZJJ|nr:hypothetical protein FEM48_Zijuj07G0000900 [Ziziphus jujuba var. spinosa]
MRDMRETQFINHHHVVVTVVLAVHFQSRVSINPGEEEREDAVVWLNKGVMKSMIRAILMMLRQRSGTHGDNPFWFRSTGQWHTEKLTGSGQLKQDVVGLYI